MRAVILAGGKGTRGKPYTEYFPKAMSPVCGKPVIDYIIKHIQKSGIIDGDIIILSDFDGLGGQIKNYYGDSHIQKENGLVFVQDSQSGTGGDLLDISHMLKDQEFLLWFVDNLCAVDLPAMLAHFKTKKSVACIATRTRRKEQTGFALVKDGIISHFAEKPVIDLPLSECLGIYILNSTDIINKIRLVRQSRTDDNSSATHNNTKATTHTPIVHRDINLSSDILAPLSLEGRISAFDIGDAEWIDAESPVVLERNDKIVQRIISTMES